MKVENEESARMLIMAGANIEATDNEGKKVLHAVKLCAWLFLYIPSQVIELARGSISKAMILKMVAERYLLLAISLQLNPTRLLSPAERNSRISCTKLIWQKLLSSLTASLKW